MGNGFIKSPNVQINDNISAIGTTPAASLSVLLTSRRGNSNAASPLILNQLSFDVYRPYIVPAQYCANGATALAWAKAQGGTVATGISGSIVLTTPTSTVVNGSFVTLTWASQPVGWSNLLGGNVTGTVTQATSAATGTVYLVSQSGYSIVLSAVTGTFDITHAVTIAFDNTGSGTPDGRATEQWILDLYYACEATNVQNTFNLKFGQPEITLSIVSDRDSNFSANPASLTLGIPDVATNNADGTVLLAWNTAPANWLYLPMVALGTSVLTQATSAATGTILEQLGPTYTTNGTGVSILLEGTNGVFDTTHAITFALDSTVNIFNLLGSKYYKWVNAGTISQITTPTNFNVDTAAFRDYILSVNTQQATAANQFGTVGVFAQSQTPSNNFLGNVRPNSDDFSVPFYYYPNRISDVYLQFSQVGASYAAFSACNLVPYNPTQGIVLNGLPVSSDTTTYVNSGPVSTAESLLQYGYTPIAVHADSGEAYIVSPVTTQTTILGVTDQEFYDVRTKQVRSEINARLDFAVKAPPFVNASTTPIILEMLGNAVYQSLLQSQTDGLIFNVEALRSQITVAFSQYNPHEAIINCVIQISPALTSILINVNVISALITPPTTQA